MYVFHYTTEDGDGGGIHVLDIGSIEQLKPGICYLYSPALSHGYANIKGEYLELLGRWEECLCEVKAFEAAMVEAQEEIEETEEEG